MAQLVTLTSDYAYKDPDLSVLKRLIINKLGNVNLIDISHDITPFDVEEALYIVQNSLPEFPEKTIHLIALDSQITAQHFPVLIEAKGQYFLSNNNGIAATATAGLKPVYYKLPFDEMRSDMQPHIEAAYQIMQGKLPSDFAVEVPELTMIKTSIPIVKYKENSDIASVISTRVIYNDTYQNAVFNLTKDFFEKHRKGRKFVIKTFHYEINTITRNYEIKVSDSNTIPTGMAGARFNNFGYLEIFNFQSNRISGGAQELLGLEQGKIVNIIFED